MRISPSTAGAGSASGTNIGPGIGTSSTGGVGATFGDADQDPQGLSDTQNLSQHAHQDADQLRQTFGKHPGDAAGAQDAPADDCHMLSLIALRPCGAGAWKWCR